MTEDHGPRDPLPGDRPVRADGGQPDGSEDEGSGEGARRLDKREEELDRRERELDEREEEILERREGVVDERESLEAREAELDDREEELDDREAAIRERERELDEREEQLDEHERTLEQYVGDQLADAQQAIAEAVEESVASAVREHGGGRTSRFGTIGGLLLGLVGMVLVIGGVANGFATEIPSIPTLFSSPAGNFGASAVLIFSGLAANLAAAARV